MEKQENIKSKAQEFNEKLRELSEKLKLSKEEQIVGLEEKENIKLGGTLERNNIFVVKIKAKNGDIHHIVIDAEANLIANIDKNGKIELSDREKQLWKSYIGKPGNQRLDQKSIYNFEKKYYLEEYKVKDNKELNKEENKNGDIKEEQKAAESLNVDEKAIITMIKIEDRETFGQAINQKLHADAYIVKYGNNKIKIMQATSNGKLQELSGVENSEFNSEVMEQLNINKSAKNQKIKAGDLTTIKTEDNKYNYVVVREKDPSKGIVIVNSTNGTQMYTFDDDGKNNLQEIETSIKYTVEKEKEKQQEEDKKEQASLEENDEYEKTPWGDAERRSRR